MNILNYLNDRGKEKSTVVAAVGSTALMVAADACTSGDTSMQLAATVAAFVASLVNANLAQRQFFKSSITAAVILLASMYGAQNVQLFLQAAAGGIMFFQMLKKENENRSGESHPSA